MKLFKLCSAIIFLVLLLTIPSIAVEGVKIDAPNGGEVLILGSSYDVKWSGKDLKGSMKIYLVKGQSIIKSLYAGQVSFQGIKTGKLTWQISSNLSTGSDYKIRILYVNAKGIKFQDESDGSFTLRSMTMRAERPYCRVLYPNGGESFEQGRNCRIRWESNMDMSRVNIYIMKGLDELRIYNNVSGIEIRPGEWRYEWAIPGDLPNGDDYKVKIRNRVMGDISNREFTITSESIEVFAPRIGAVWYRTQNQAITFRCEGFTQNIKVWAEGYPAYPIAEDLPPSTEMVMWTNLGVIGAVSIGGTDQIVVSTMDGTIVGRSGRFSLLDPGIEVTSPAGGSRVRTGGHDTTIRWNAPHLGGNVNIILYRRPRTGGAWTKVSPNLFTNTPNDGSEVWTVDLVSDVEYKVRVESRRQPEFYDDSGVFTIYLRIKP